MPDMAVAFIEENECIGCVKCIRACPVDAIIGAPQQMHTVIAELCTGCELCIPPCPVDCISMLPVTARHHKETTVRAAGHAEKRSAARAARLAREAAEQNRKKNPATRSKTDDRLEFIKAAVARTRAKRERLKNTFGHRNKDE